MQSTVTWEEIRDGKVTDVYFERTREILQARDIHKVVTAEFTAKSLPEKYDWAVFSGLNEAADLLADIPVDVESIPEGTLFHPNEPVLSITGDYLDFGVYETAILGYLCQASGIATKAARVRKSAGDRPAVSFGARRMHPSIAPMVERNAYIGGCDGVATVAAAEYLGQEPVGTIPHALVLLMGDTVEATRAFEEIIDTKVNRISLIDTFSDEKFESLRVAESLGDALFGIRLDTPGSRRGDMLEILKEVRWELDLHGYDQVQLFVSGGLDEYTIDRYNEVADAYGVGTSISAAPTIDYAMDIVEIEGKPMAKRGKPSGTKTLWRCEEDFTYQTTPRIPESQAPRCPTCDRQMAPLTGTLYNDGKRTRELPDHDSIRDYVLQQLPLVELILDK